MNKTIFISILIVSKSVFSFAQWDEQSILPNDIFFNDVIVLDNNHCWIVGQDGIVLKSFNNGFTWLRLSSQTTKTLNAVWFTNDQNGWLCGDYGTFKYTINGGFYWQESSLTTENDLKDIFFINDNTGWVVGDNGLIYSTNDGGITWESQISGTTHDLWSVHFINENEGWTAGYAGDILHTTNGGSSWTMQPQAVLDELFCIYFTDEYHGWASGADGLLKTTDGGDTWETNLYQYGFGYRSVFFENASSGYLIINTGLSGTLHYTNDGGETWEFKNESGYTLRSIHFCDEGFGFAVGYPDNIIYSPFFGGGCGNLQINPELTGFGDVHFLDSLNGWATGYGIVHTNDGGNNWYTQRYDSENYINQVFFTSLDIGYASSFSGVILKTTNGGKTWNQLENAPDNYYSSIHFSDDLNGWFSCYGGGIVHTTDGGQTWSQESYQNNFASVFFTDEQHGCVVGQIGNTAPYGLIKMTGDGGLTWTDTQTYAWLNDVYFINQNNGWIVGQNSFAYKSIDGGESWEFMDLGYSSDLYEVEFTDENNGWICGEDGLILHTNDGGETWEEQSMPNNEYVMAIDFINSDKGWAVGGGLFHTDNGGTVGIRNNTSENSVDLSISPNPFHEFLNVSFDLKNKSSIRIEILNMNGQLVHSAFQNRFPAGIHQQTINLADLSKGLYYLRFVTKHNIVTRKIIKL